MRTNHHQQIPLTTNLNLLLAFSPTASVTLEIRPPSLYHPIDLTNPTYRTTHCAMSLNTVTLSPARTPTPLQDEVDIRHVDSIEYTITLPSNGKKFEGKGKIFLTDLRVRAQ